MCARNCCIAIYWIYNVFVVAVGLSFRERGGV